MRLPIAQFKGIESGPVVIIGNGPSMNDFEGKTFACPIIGINLSVDYFPEQSYFVTVAFDRLNDIAAGKIRANKAVFTCLHKAHVVPDKITQPIVFADMSKEDLYFKLAVCGFMPPKHNIFDPDLEKPTFKTFGGMFAIQVALFLGFTTLYLVGFDGGTVHFKEYRRDHIPAEYHNMCFSHVKEYLKDKPNIKLYNCSKTSKIVWFEYGIPPLKGDLC